MVKTKKKSAHKCKLVLSYDNDSDSDTVDTLTIAEQSDEALSQDNTKKKRRAKLLMSAEPENALIDWIRQTP